MRGLCHGGSGDATRYVAAHAAEFERVVCIGGDGTLNETIAGLLQAQLNIPIGYIPAGTTNDYASSRDTSDVLQAARDAQAENRANWTSAALTGAILPIQPLAVLLRARRTARRNP